MREKFFLRKFKENNEIQKCLSVNVIFGLPCIFSLGILIADSGVFYDITGIWLLINTGLIGLNVVFFLAFLLRQKNEIVLVMFFIHILLVFWDIYGTVLIIDHENHGIHSNNIILLVSVTVGILMQTCFFFKFCIINLLSPFHAHYLKISN